MKRSHSPSTCQTSRSTQHNGVTLQRQRGSACGLGQIPLLGLHYVNYVYTYKQKALTMRCYDSQHFEHFRSPPTKSDQTEILVGEETSSINIIGTGDARGITTFLSNMFLSRTVV